jgi:hypothetical protein
MIIYPPHIGSTIPGFVGNENSATIVIPFTHNAAVDKTNVKTMCLLVKSLSNSKIIGNASTTNFDLSKGEAEFQVQDIPFVSGAYYKF